MSAPSLSPEERNTALTAEMISAAKQYAAAGIPVFPVGGNKVPLVSWSTEATKDPDQIEKWWRRWPTAMIGAPTGPRSGFVVLDVDQKNGIDGHSTLHTLGFSIPKDAVEVKTPSGGSHYYFGFWESGLKNSAGKIGSGIDLRAEGGMIILPPSRPTISGSDYHFAHAQNFGALSQIATPLPHWAYSTKATGTSYRPALPINTFGTGATTAYGQAALDREFERVSTAPAGTANNSLNVAAHAIGQLVAGGEISRTDANCLLEAASQRKMDDVEAAATFESGFRAGCNEPRSAPTSVTNGTAPIGGKMPRTGVARALADEARKTSPVIVPLPFSWIEEKHVTKRDWLYGKHLIRKFVSATVSAGGIGKSILVQTEALAMVSAKKILDVSVAQPPLRVWYINLEDPIDELNRRFVAIRKYFKLNDADVAGRLFVNSGRDTPITIAEKAGDKIIVSPHVVRQLVEGIQRNKIDVLIIDPFVASHRLPENDNTAIEIAIRTWSDIAERGNCAIELVHHARKQNGENLTAESARGGSAFAASCREVRVLNRMTENDAARLGAENHRSHFLASSEKQNMSASSDQQDWYEMKTVTLENSDDVGIVTRWVPPDMAIFASDQVLRSVQEKFEASSYRANPQSPDWGGYIVANELGIDVGQGMTRVNKTGPQKAALRQVQGVLGHWLKTGAITVVERANHKREMKKCYAVPKKSQS
ncbi:bifunctional DNA primase/polymerase [Phyllobacterium endophyticum]|nr:bifunctional DNA primase/polymerase [Phyllobacterium endophyticum]MBB3236132.1 hypothetical protein [Phyllobacterium endophyticum]